MKYFDKVYCINIADAPERRILMEEGFKRVLPEEDVQFWETVKKSFLNNEVARCVTKDRINNNTQKGIKLPIDGEYYEWFLNGNKNIMGVIFDCAYNIYSILKIAYLKGYQHIAIFEDDFKFIEDTDKITRILDAMPEDYHLIRFYSSGYQNVEDKNETDYISWKEMKDPNKLGMGNGGIGMLALDRIGIANYISYLENINFISDIPLMDFYFWANSVLNCYRPAQLIYEPDYNNEKISSTVLTCNN